MSCIFIPPSASRRTLNGSAVVVIGVDRHGVGSNRAPTAPFRATRRPNTVRLPATWEAVWQHTGSSEENPSKRRLVRRVFEGK
jgi:hypothetical protein